MESQDPNAPQAAGTDLDKADPLFIISVDGIDFKPDPRFRPEERYRINRLALDDGRKAGEMFSNAVLRAQIMGEGVLDDFMRDHPDGAMGRAIFALFRGIPDMLLELYTFLAQFMQDEKQNPIQPVDFGDARKFPAGAFWRIADALQQHPDVEDFLSGAGGLKRKILQENPQLAGLWDKILATLDGSSAKSPTTSGGKSPSTSSGPATESETTKSVADPAGKPVMGVQLA